MKRLYLDRSIVLQLFLALGGAKQYSQLIEGIDRLSAGYDLIYFEPSGISAVESSARRWEAVSQKLTAVPGDTGDRIRELAKRVEDQFLAQLQQNEIVLNAAQRYNAAKGGIPRDIAEILRYSFQILATATVLESEVLLDENRAPSVAATLQALGGAEIPRNDSAAKAFGNPLRALAGGESAGDIVLRVLPKVEAPAPTPDNDAPHDILVSYARPDALFVRDLVGVLEKGGYLVWWDQHLQGGVQYSEVIDRKLKTAKCVVVVWSDASVNSVWVKDEAATARDAGKLLPVSIAGQRPPLGFRQFQTVGIEDMRGAIPAELKSALDRFLGGDGAAAQAASASAPTSMSPPVSAPTPSMVAAPSRKADVERAVVPPKKRGSGGLLGVVFLLIVLLGGAAAGLVYFGPQYGIAQPKEWFDAARAAVIGS